MPSFDPRFSINRETSLPGQVTTVDHDSPARQIGGSVAKFDFSRKIEFLVSIDSMTYRIPHSSKTNFATEPYSVARCLAAVVQRRPRHSFCVDRDPSYDRARTLDGAGKCLDIISTVAVPIKNAPDVLAASCASGGICWIDFSGRRSFPCIAIAANSSVAIGRGD